MVSILNFSSYIDSNRVVVKEELLMQPSLNYDTKHMLMPLWSVSSNLRFFPLMLKWHKDNQLFSKTVYFSPKIIAYYSILLFQNEANYS